MMPRYWLTYTLLAALLAAPTLQPWVSDSPQDLNGDACVDVLDVQLLVASLLSHGETDTDLNGDDRVDVLDVQAFLAGRGSADSPDEPAPVEHPPALTPAPVLTHQPHVFAGLLHASVDTAAWKTLLSARETVPRRLPNTGTLRYLFRLTSHAPPVTGPMIEA